MHSWVSRPVLAALLLFAYFVLTHAAVLTGIAFLAQGAWLGLAGLVILVVPGVLGFGVGAVLAAALLVADADTLLKFPPVVINLALAAWFGRSLAPGEEPVISWFARLVRGVELPADLARYTRNSTVRWTVFFVGMAAVAAALAVLATPQTWSLFANGINYLLVGALFVGEFAYRRLRYRHHRHAHLAEVVRTIVRARGLAPRRTARK
jgi:uncharacterized membrane protein